jgi:hypothetical protein
MGSVLHGASCAVHKIGQRRIQPVLCALTHAADCSPFCGCSLFCGCAVPCACRRILDRSSTQRYFSANVTFTTVVMSFSMLVTSFMP